MIPGNGYVYLCGKMRGVPEFGFPAFREAAANLRAAGITVCNPAEKDEKDGFTAEGMTGHEDLAALGFDLYAALAWDTAAVANPHCKAVVCLPGWEGSSGAKAEVALANALRTPIYEYFPVPKGQPRFALLKINVEMEVRCNVIA